MVTKELALPVYRRILSRISRQSVPAKPPLQIEQVVSDPVQDTSTGPDVLPVMMMEQRSPRGPGVN